MNDRIKEIQASLNMSQKDFAEAIGIAPGALSNIYSNRTNATNNHVKGIHNAFPQINVNWLMFGEGEMYVSQTEETSSSTTPQAPGAPTQAPESSNNGASVHAPGYEGTLFDQPAMPADDLIPFQGVRTTPPARRGVKAESNPNVQAANSTAQIANAIAKNFDIPRRQVKEIRVFFDDGTYETFVPGK